MPRVGLDAMPQEGIDAMPWVGMHQGVRPWPSQQLGEPLHSRSPVCQHKMFRRAQRALVLCSGVRRAALGDKGDLQAGKRFLR